MDRLQGYGTNGYDYRKSAIERNNSSRLKWMVSEAKKSAEKREQDEKNSQTTSFINKTSSLSELNDFIKFFGFAIFSCVLLSP